MGLTVLALQVQPTKESPARPNISNQPLERLCRMTIILALLFAAHVCRKIGKALS